MLIAEQTDGKDYQNKWIKQKQINFIDMYINIEKYFSFEWKQSSNLHSIYVHLNIS